MNDALFGVGSLGLDTGTVGRTLGRRIAVHEFDTRLERTTSHAGGAGCVSILENGAPGTIRTSDPQIRSLMLYPAELRARTAQNRQAAT